MIRFEHVKKSFGDRLVLNDLSFTVPKGEVLFILGKSGTGKSVTLKTLVGLLKADSGRVLIEDHAGYKTLSVMDLDDDGLAHARRLCGMVFQHPALLDSLSIYENVSFGLKNLNEEQKRKRVIECLELVHLDERILHLNPTEISFGMQKRVSIARTIAPAPKALLFDEPTTGLDPITTNAINELIIELAKSLGVTIIVVSHDMGCALRAADRILVLDAGQILALGSPAEIRQSQHPLIKDFLSENRGTS